MSDDLLRTPTEGQDLTESLFPGSTVKGSPSPRLSFKGWALGVVSREYADAIGVFFGTASQGLVPKPLAKEGAPR